MYKNQHIIVSRQDLCHELIWLKESRLVRLSECLPTIFQLSAKKISDIENPDADCKMSDVMLYLKMIGAKLEIALYEVYSANDMKQLRLSFQQIHQESELKLFDIAKKANVPFKVIYNFVYRKSDITVDSFLRVAEAMDLLLKFI